jgi:uncharacterized protein YhhL (DUF1145 family)
MHKHQSWAVLAGTFFLLLATLGRAQIAQVPPPVVTGPVVPVGIECPGQKKCNGACIPLNEICLLEPVGTTTSIKQCPKLGPFFEYFNLLYPWAVGTAMGIVVLMIVFGGIQITMSEGDQSARSAGIERVKWAIFGLFMILFSVLILTTINPYFYVTTPPAAGENCP